MVECIFSKIPCFQHILLRIFKSEICKFYLGNKVQKAMFLVVTRLDVHFGSECPFLSVPIGRTSKIVRPKNRVPKGKLIPSPALVEDDFFVSFNVKYPYKKLNFPRDTLKCMHDNDQLNFLAHFG